MNICIFFHVGGGFRGGDREFRDFRGRDFHDDRDRQGRGPGRFQRDSREMGNMGNQLPMALAAALNQAGWGMLLQNMQGQGGPGNQGGPNNSGGTGNSGNQQPPMGVTRMVWAEVMGAPTVWHGARATKEVEQEIMQLVVTLVTRLKGVGRMKICHHKHPSVLV